MVASDDALPIASVVVGTRRREDLGDIEALARSIEQWGLIHPIVVDADNNLIAGERRLMACEALGYLEVPIRYLGTLTETERREIELEENLRRKDLTTYERAKTMVALVETAREVVTEEPVRNGRTKPGSERDVEARTGIDRTTARKAGQHVETADFYPFMQSPDWKQYHVLEARERLTAMPEQDRSKAAAIVSEPGIPPKTAISMLSNLAHMETPDRREIFDLYASQDSRKVALAKTRAAQLPPDPDPRVIKLGAVIRELRECLRLFPNDPCNLALAALIDSAVSVQQQIREASNA